MPVSELKQLLKIVVRLYIVKALEVMGQECGIAMIFPADNVRNKRVEHINSNG